MKISLLTTRTGIALGLAALLLAAGLVIEMKYARPQLSKISELQAQKQEIRSQFVQQLELEDRCRRLAAHFALDDLSDLATPAAIDPVSYIGNAINRAGLVRLDLRNMGGHDFGTIRRTDLNLRVIGKFDQLQAFVKDIETGRRLASIEFFNVKTRKGASGLEGRFNISIVDPMGGLQQ